MESYAVEPEAGMATSAADLIWTQAIMNFHLTDNEILIPLNITAVIGSSSIDQLKLQLSWDYPPGYTYTWANFCLRTFLGRPCVAFVDESLGCVRVLARPEFNGLGSATDNLVLAQTSTERQFELTDCTARSPEKMDKKTEKRNKVPRPPNAFILYRKHYHSILKEQDPNMHNNDICE